MSKTSKITSIDLEKTIMAKVKSNEIVIKPRWYFLFGSLLMILGLASFSIGAIFLTNLTLFLLRRHGPMGQWRLQIMLDSFPLWVPILAVLGTILGIWMLKKYDFSYKKNFWLILIGFILAIILAAFAIDYLGLNESWARQGPMQRFYQQIEGSPKKSIQMQNRPGNGFYQKGQ